MKSLPILYSFRRCPYAIRARMALACAEIRVQLREVSLGDMPAAMLQLSPKATVPVLHLADGRVIDESLEVMTWSLAQADPQRWLEMDAESGRLIERSDAEFKPLLDCYKYADRHPELSPLEHRQRAQVFVAELEERLSRQSFLGDDRCRLVDVAIFPFIRQFAGVEPRWFERSEYSALRAWLDALLGSELFQRVMIKHPFWQPGDEPVYS